MKNDMIPMRKKEKKGRKTHKCKSRSTKGEKHDREE